MRRRSERKKSTDVVQSPPPVLKRSRRSRRSSSQTETPQKTNKTDIENGQNEVPNEDLATLSSVAEPKNNGELVEVESSVPTPKEDTKIDSLRDQRLETITEVPIKNENDIIKNNTEEATPKEEEELSEIKGSEENPIKENKSNKDETPTKLAQEESNDVLEEEEEQKEIPKTDVHSPTIDVAENVVEKTKGGEVSENSKETELEQEKNKSPEKTETSATVCETKKTLSRNKERRAQIILRKKEQENDENDEFNNTSEKVSTPSTEKKKSTKKRRWLSKRATDSNTQILAISTDSLKNLISDVHPVPLCDVKLESSSEVEEIESEREEGEASPTPVKSRTEKPSVFDRDRISSKMYENPIRKISILSDRDDHLPPIPTKNETSSILYITNLVRPFTVLQLKGLLARTGKIVDNRFWIDKIKSKCYIQYETEDEAIETRHALHGVRWPTSNPKCLNVDFGTAADMEKAMMSSQEAGPQFGHELGRENRVVGTGWDRDRFDYEEKKIQVGRPVREWDVGKREELEIEAERARKRDKIRSGERSERVIHNDRVDKESIRIDERSERERDRKRRSSDRERRRSLSASPARKIKKKNNDPPLRLLDDLFRKTKTTPCIYWLPLTPEQIAEKEAFRLRRVAEHQERIRQRELEKEKDRERERERDREREKERRRERDRSNGHRRTNSRDRRRY
ncbi:apoptotic chromatin condensation inducer in the nucleus isoform X2 [Eupeodes corollae]|uniref:apoptotic chromatin condensation inducer in the nucleus isoform X2 n=1 Tax=Eupeodes corollae TaxID=290404 RepID=UPI0024925900|nr:apoptotic chromatin condensation inducer in the nucleus isoform X2 [Eupeodes corollae]